MYSDFKEMALGFNEDYSSPLFYSDEEQQNLAGVECPFCGEPIYFDEWDEDSSWAACPICDNEGLYEFDEGFEYEFDEDYDEEEHEDEAAEGK